jgi:hypothetical protein
MKLKELFEELLTKNITITKSEIKDGHFPPEHNYKGINLVGDFDCYRCINLTSLEGCPDVVRGTFFLTNCQSLKTLKNAPKKVNSFNANFCHGLTSLEFCPEVRQNFSIYQCKKLTSLEFGPTEITGNYIISNCFKLTSLEHAPKSVKNFSCDGCRDLTSLEGIGRDYLTSITGELEISDTITSNILGILKIKNLNDVSTKDLWDELKEAVDIINKHLETGRRVSKCKQELIEAGLKEFAKL